MKTKSEFKKKGYRPKEKSSKSWKKIKDFIKVKIPNALRNITHSMEIGFILKSLYKPKALAIISHAIIFTATTMDIDWEKKSFWNSLNLVAITIAVSKKTSAAALILIRKEDSLNMVLVFPAKNLQLKDGF